MHRRALITGAAGFIGSHLVESLLADGWSVTGVDNLDPFYGEDIKRQNLTAACRSRRFSFVVEDICDIQSMKSRLSGGYDVIVHLAARAGVRPSIDGPLAYQETNVRGTQNLLELARDWNTKQFVFASSSSVYGVNPNVPWSEDDKVLMPISPYASTKVSCELLGHVYAHLFGIRFVALRFFTVYGPRQRPDLAIHKFGRLMLAGQPIPVFGAGETRRDYTFIGDVVQGMRAAMEYGGSNYEVFNLGNDRTVTLLELIQLLGEALDVRPELKFLPAQPGDAPQTWANITKARTLLNYSPETPIGEGIQKFADWLKKDVSTGGQSLSPDSGAPLKSFSIRA